MAFDASAPDLTVGVVGTGTMGRGIMQVAAEGGLRVLAFDAKPGAAQAAVDFVARMLQRAAAKGSIAPEAVAASLERITLAQGLEEVATANLVIEAIVERLDVKQALFAKLDALAGPATILASNTSSIPISSLAAATGRPDRVIGMHFFNPVPLMGLVEVVRGLDTSDETAAAIVELAEELGKTPAEARDLPGFVSNRILMPFINEAAYALLEGVGDAESIDTIARLGFNHPIGPLALADLIGLDTCVAIMDVLHGGLGSPKYAPCPLLRQYVQAGRLGRKSGRGFYRYG